MCSCSDLTQTTHSNNPLEQTNDYYIFRNLLESYCYHDWWGSNFRTNYRHRHSNSTFYISANRLKAYSRLQTYSRRARQKKRSAQIRPLLRLRYRPRRPRRLHLRQPIKRRFRLDVQRMQRLLHQRRPPRRLTTPRARTTTSGKHLIMCIIY